MENAAVQAAMERLYEMRNRHILVCVHLYQIYRVPIRVNVAASSTRPWNRGAMLPLQLSRCRYCCCCYRFSLEREAHPQCTISAWTRYRYWIRRIVFLRSWEEEDYLHQSWRHRVENALDPPRARTHLLTVRLCFPMKNT